MGAELRRRRRALVGYEQLTREAWEADLVAYDQLLLVAATMLEVPTDVPAAADATVVDDAPLVDDAPVVAEALTARQRDRMEVGLAAAGLDIRTDDL